MVIVNSDYLYNISYFLFLISHCISCLSTYTLKLCIFLAAMFVTLAGWCTVVCCFPLRMCLAKFLFVACDHAFCEFYNHWDLGCVFVNPSDMKVIVVSFSVALAQCV